MHTIEPLPLVPWPVSVRRAPGSYRIKQRSATLGACARPDEHVAVHHKLGELGLRVVVDETLPALTVRIGRPKRSARAAPEWDEGYALHVDRGGIELRGHDVAGLYWGLVTLDQLLNGAPVAPCVEIVDYPAFAFRMHHDDVSRKQISTADDFKRIVRTLSRYKIRYYTPYMEDVLHLKSYPDIGKGRGKLMPREVEAILDEARRHNVTVFPTYSLIGHQENLLAVPKYRKYARTVFQSPSAYDVSKPALKPYLRKVIRDVCRAFPDAPYFHACFDEVIGLTERELIAHANWCAREIARHGKRMLMWVDMFKNHFGLKALRKLDDSIVPVEWQYADPSGVEGAYRKAGVVPLGLAGYNTWCAFLPDFALGKANLDAWAKLMGNWGGQGYGSSQWGDNGYENSRHLLWNLIAYNAETSWSGRARRADFESRFQSTFYGRRLPALERVVARAPRRKISASAAWRLFRYAIPAMIRAVTADRTLARRAASDLKLLRSWTKSVAAARGRALRERDHFDHFDVALRREIDVRERLLLAARIAGGLPGAALRRAVGTARRNLDGVRRAYEKTWLRHNKRPNIEVSLSVYDAVARSLDELLRPPPRVPRTFLPLDLSGIYDTCEASVGGMPIGPGVVNRVPFAFADATRTHALLGRGDAVRLTFASSKIADIHLLYGGWAIPMDAKAHWPLVELRLRNGKRVVFEEKLRVVRHIVDWFAPLGDHMWAGGGLRHADAKRVRFGLTPGAHHGILHLSGFAARGRVADSLELRVTGDGKAKLALFAATVQAGG